MIRHATKSVSRYVQAAEAACDVPAKSPWGLAWDHYYEGHPLDSNPFDEETETSDYNEYRAGWWDAHHAHQEEAN